MVCDSDDLLNENWQFNFNNFLKNQKYSDVVVFKTNINKNKHISVKIIFTKMILIKVCLSSQL